MMTHMHPYANTLYCSVLSPMLLFPGFRVQGFSRLGFLISGRSAALPSFYVVTERCAVAFLWFSFPVVMSEMSERP